jgi:hypothetical protein
MRFSPGCNCCGPPPPCAGTTKICATITADGCAGGVAYGALITVKDAGGTTVGTCTVTGQVVSLTRTSGGSGYTNGTGYSIGFAGGAGTGAAGTFDVVGGVVVNLVLTANGSGYTSAPTLSFPGAGAGTGAAGTAAVQARCCVDITLAGTYTVTANIPGATTVTTTVPALCSVTTNVSLSFPANSLGTVCFTLTHCDGGNGGDTVSITGAGTTSGVTNSSGQLCMRLGVGSYNYTLTTPGGTSKSGSFVVNPCTTTNVNAGTAITQVCISARTDAPAGCTATLTVKNQGTGAVLGTGSLTTSFTGGIFFGQGCVSITEVISTNLTGFNITWAFTNFSSSSNATAQCYPSGFPFFANFSGFGAPC